MQIYLYNTIFKRKIKATSRRLALIDLLEMERRFSMSKVLIIANNIVIASSIKSEFSKAGWVADDLNLHVITKQSNYNVGQHKCVLMVIDELFLRNFGKYIQEMTLMIRNCAVCTSFYLAFEGEYDPIFASWLEYTKRLFKTILNKQILHSSIQEIIKLETNHVPRAAYVSPMDAF